MNIDMKLIIFRMNLVMDLIFEYGKAFTNTSL